MFRSTAVKFVLLTFAFVGLTIAIGDHADAQASKKNASPKDGDDVVAEDQIVKHVPTILEIDHKIQTSDPPHLVITAYGQVPTGGWTSVQLVRRIYVTPPADGIWEYDLFGVPPTGPATQVLTKVKAMNAWEDFDQSIKGIRVYGIGRGAKEIRFKGSDDKR